MDSSRLTRALKVLNLLQTRRGATVDYLAETLKCGRLTIQRDIDYIKSFVETVCFDNQTGTFSVAQDLQPDAPALGEDEHVALQVATLLSPVSRISPFAENIRTAIAGLASHAPRHVELRVDNLVASVLFETVSPPDPPQPLDVFHKVVRAIARRRQMRLCWHEPDETERTTKISPYLLVAASDGWTLVGRSSLHRLIVRVPLESIQTVELIDQTYELPVEYLRSSHSRAASLRRATFSLEAVHSASPHSDSS